MRAGLEVSALKAVNDNGKTQNYKLLINVKILSLKLIAVASKQKSKDKFAVTIQVYIKGCVS